MATLCAELPPLRVLLVMDNLVGHTTPELLIWMFQRGILPLYTPLSGSWLNWQSRSRGLPSDEHWKDSTHKHQKRSSNGWSLPCEGGIPILPHLSGVANGRRDEHALDRGGINSR